MAAASEDKNLPYIRGVRLGALFNSRTGRMVPPDKVPSSSGRKLKEPRTWKRWTVVRTGPDLYRALHVPYPLALKEEGIDVAMGVLCLRQVLAGQAPEPDVPLVEWRQALSSPNCRALLLQAGTEMRERTVDASAYTPAVSPDPDISHFVHRVVIRKQLFILVILKAKGEQGTVLIDAALKHLPENQKMFEGTELAFTMLDSYMEVGSVDASFSVHPNRKQISSLKEAVKLLSDSLSQPDAKPCPKAAADDSSSDDDDDASDDATSTIRCFLRPYHSDATCKDPTEVCPPKKRTKEMKQDVDGLYHNCLRGKKLFDEQRDDEYREYQREELQKRRNAITQSKGEFEEVIKKQSVFEKSTSSQEEELVKKYNQKNFEAETHAFIQMLKHMLPPSKGPLNLLLLGKTGHGKSSTGNTILQVSDAFAASGGTVGTTTKCEVRMGKVDGRVFKIVDSPGIFDPSNFHAALQEICTAITLCTEGFHAVLIVWKYGTKLTPEEIKSIECLKKVFGGDLLEKHGIFLLTNGDQFELARQRGEHCHKTFGAWVRDQGQKDWQFQSTVGECKGRCILFDNITENPEKKKIQLFDLVDVVERMMKQEDYTILNNELFTLAKKNLDKMETKKRKALKQKAEKLSQKIDSILKAVKALPTVQQKELENKRKFLEGYWLNLQDTINLTNDVLDKVSEHASHLEEDVEEIEAQTKLSAEYGVSVEESTGVGNFEKLSAQADKRIADAARVVRGKEAMAAEAGKMTAKESGINCFPGNAIVRLQDGRQIKMTSLHEGDVVLCGRKDGSLTYSAVYMFGHKDEFPALCCLALSTRIATLRVSHDHLVFLRHFGNCTAVPARHVQVGDAIAVYRPGAATLQWEPVTLIQSRWETGVMAPFTLEGTMVVDDILASCYVAVTSHMLCHALLWPMRKLAVLAPRLSAHLHRPGEGGLPPWVRLCLHHLLPWLPRHRLLSA